MIMKNNFGRLRRSPREMYVEWKIDNYFSFAPKVDEIWISHVFSLSSVDWYFHLQPNGSELLYSEGYIGLNVFNQSTVASLPVHFTKGIKRSDGNVYKSIQYFTHLDDTVSHSCFFKSCILFKDKDIIAADGTVTFFFQIERAKDITGKPDLFSLPDNNVLVQNISDMLMCNDTFDIILKVGEQTLKAHKFILMARSKVFATMFKHDMLESNSGIVEIKDCDADAFQDFLTYLYTAKLNCMCISRMILIYCIAHKYQVEKLRKTCINYLCTNLTLENFCNVLGVAQMYDEKELMASVKRFFLNNAPKILVTEAWKEFHQKHVSFSNDLFIEYAKRFNK